MKAFGASIVLVILAAVTQAAPAPVPQTECNPNPHGRSCGALLYGAAGVSAFASAPIDFQQHPTNVGFSVSKISNPDNGMFEYVTFYGVDGSVLTLAPGETVDVGPPQVQNKMFCEIICPS